MTDQPETMDKTRLLAEIARTDAELEATLQGLEAELVERPEVYDGLSIKDVVAHLAAWERLATGWVEAGLRGETPVRWAPGFEVPEDADTDTVNAVMDRLNAHIFAEHHDQPYADVLAGYRAAHRRLVEVIGGLSKEDLVDGTRFAWTGGHPLWIFIAGNSFDHIPEHVDLIRAFLRRDE
jgi:hypothetical protein